VSVELLRAALEHHAAGRLPEAESLYRQVLTKDPRNIDALHFLGAIAHQRGDQATAIDLISQALAWHATNAPAQNNLGCALRAQGRLADAAAAFQKAVDIAPDFPDAHLNLARAWRALGDLARSESSYHAALRVSPRLAEVRGELASLLISLMRPQEAAAACEAALAIQPGLAEVRYNLAVALRDLGRRAEAIVQVERAIQLSPTLVPAHYLLGHLHLETDRRDAAMTAFDNVVKFDPKHIEARWSRVMAELPGVYGPHEDPREVRAAFARQLKELENWFEHTPIADPSAGVGVQQPFRLAYQEENNVDLLKQHGGLCTRLMSAWRGRHAAAPAAGRSKSTPHPIRVGIVSGHFRDHSVWHAIIKGWIEHLDRKRFALACINLGPPPDDASKNVISRATHFVQGPKDLSQCLASIEAWRPDVLIYPEIGMEPLALKLASLRLAPVQAASWGHPETSGLATIDYYLSAEGLEPPGAQAHYSEELVLLPHLGTFFDERRFALEPPDIGTPGSAPVLVCPGVPFKYAPQHDDTLVEIALRLGKCQLVFFEHPNQEQFDKLRRRLASAFRARGVRGENYLTFVPWLSKPRFHGMLARATVFLDTIGFSGFNTALHAVGRALPIVGWQGRFLRGRFASGILERMGMRELVAASRQQYVELAVRIASDADYRAAISRQLAERRAVLFADLAPVRALERFLVEATGRL
jgi:protein O-GlcNAc transferase